MDELMSKISDILNNKESMEQIQKIADMLGADSQDSSPEQSSVLNASKSKNTETSEKANSDGLNLDINKIMKIQQIFSKANKNDYNTDFLYALKPLLKEENKQKIDKINKIFKLLALWPLIKESGLLGGDLFDII